MTGTDHTHFRIDLKYMFRHKNKFLTRQFGDSSLCSTSFSKAKAMEDFLYQIVLHFLSDHPPQLCIGIAKIDGKEILTQTILNALGHQCKSLHGIADRCLLIFLCEEKL